jgi:hypothetical protein
MIHDRVGDSVRVGTQGSRRDAVEGKQGRSIGQAIWSACALICGRLGSVWFECTVAIEARIPRLNEPLRLEPGTSPSQTR